MNGLRVGITILGLGGLTLGGLFVAYKMQNWVSHPLQSTADLVTTTMKAAPAGILKNVNASIDATKDYWHDLVAKHSDNRGRGFLGLLTTVPRIMAGGAIGALGIHN